MLVTLANNQTVAANSSSTFTYSPDSLQSVMINVEDADWDDMRITVQVGSTTICNGVSMYGLVGLSILQCEGYFAVSGANAFASLNFGNHIFTGNDNLYVTVEATGEATAIDISAIVNVPGKPNPLRLTEYSDNTFTSNNNLFALCWNAAKSNIDEDAYNCEIRTSVDSSAPSFISSSSYYRSQSIGIASWNAFGVLNDHLVPLNTTYNYSASATTDRILTIERMLVSNTQIAQAKRSAARTFSMQSRS